MISEEIITKELPAFALQTA